MSLFVRFDLSNLALDITDWNKTETDENTSCPMGDWTSQNWTKRDGRNHFTDNKKHPATCKTAAELAVKKRAKELHISIFSFSISLGRPLLLHCLRCYYCVLRRTPKSSTDGKYQLLPSWKNELHPGSTSFIFFLQITAITVHRSVISKLSTVSLLSR